MENIISAKRKEIIEEEAVIQSLKDEDNQTSENEVRERN